MNITIVPNSLVRDQERSYASPKRKRRESLRVRFGLA